MTAIGHVTLRVTDLEACLDHAQHVLGLQVVDRSPDEVFLSSGGPHHALHLIRDGQASVDRIGLVAAGHDQLDLLARRLADEGITPEADGPAPYVERAVVFRAPEDFTFEVYTGMKMVEFNYPTTGIRPRRLGHVNVRTRDPHRLAAFIQRVLDFLVSDVIGDQAYFLRCNHDHHGIAVTTGPGQLHHYAWEVRDMSELVRLCDLLDERRVPVLQGPLRHGAGENIAVYHVEPSGAVVEYYTDMERIYDDRHRSGRWEADDPRWLSRWARASISGEYRQLGLPPRVAEGVG